MQYLIFKNTTYEVDHAVKGTDFIHGYDATGKVVVAFEGVTDFSVFEYDGSYLAPEDCISEPCNDLKYCAGKLQKRDGTAVTPADVGAAPADSVGTNKVFKKLTDIGITTFPTTISTVASKMPNNSTLILDSRDIVSGGANEISDLGVGNAGTYMIMRGNTASRVQLLHIYGSASGETSFIQVGNYAVTPNTVSWVRAVKTSGDTMTGSLQIDGSWKGVSFGENAAILNAGTRLTFDQRPQNSTGSYERYTLPTPTERTTDVWYNILTTKDTKDFVTAQGKSGNWHYRKYNSGYCECWRTVGQTVATTQWETWGGICLTPIVSVGVLPFTVYGATPFVTAHNGGSTFSLGVITKGDISSTTANNLQGFRGVAANEAINVVYNYYVVGRWKE